MIKVLEYVDQQGKNPFSEWFDSLNPVAAAKVTTALYRMEQGNLSNTTGVGAGVYEYRLNHGPGYRVYFGKDGDKIIILLGGGTKKRQQKDIEEAKAHWKTYKQRK